MNGGIVNIIFLFFALTANAKVITVPTPNVSAQDIHAELVEGGLKKAGYFVTSFKCVPSKCEVVVPDWSTITASDLAPIFNGTKTRSQQAAERKSMLDELAAIEAKADADITINELRRAFRLMMRLQGLTRQP